MSEATVEIDRVTLQLHVTAASGRADVLGWRLRDAVASALQANIPDHFSTAQFNGAEVIFIDRMAVSCDVATAWTDDRVAQQFCTAFAAQLDRAAASATTIRFRDRAEHVAAFLIALCDGAAWQRWWFDEFVGLKPLSLATALRTVLINEGETGISALARLADHSLRRVSDCMAASDCARVLQSWAALRGAHDNSVSLPEIIRMAELESLSSPDALLRTAARLERTAVTRVGRHTLDRLGVVSRLIDRARSGEVSEWVSDLPAREWLAHNVAACGLDRLWVDTCTDQECVELAEHLNQVRAPATSRADKASGESAPVFTPYGGAMLLLARLASNGMWSRWRDALVAGIRKAHQEEINGGKLTRCLAAADELAAALALSIVAQALGPEVAQAIRSDPALGRIAGLKSHSVDELIRPRGYTIARLLVGPSHHAFQQCEWFAIGASAQPAIYGLLDTRRGTLHGLRRVGDKAARHQSLKQQKTPVRSQPEQGTACAGSGGSTCDDVVQWWNTHLGSSGSQPLSVYAHALSLLRDLGASLPGLAGSSPAYLRAQCLALSATVTTTADRVDAWLTRAPLEVLLKLSGIKRGEWKLPDGRKLVLHDQEAS